MIDTNVEAVRQKLLARSQVGINKYGVTTNRTDLTVLDWLTHLQEELMDACVYLEACINDNQQEAQSHSAAAARP